MRLRSAVGRAPPLQGDGRRFKSYRNHLEDMALTEEEKEILEEELRIICEDIIEDETRSKYLRLIEARDRIYGLFDESEKTVKQYIGAAVRESDYLDKWSNGAFIIDEEKLYEK